MPRVHLKFLIFGAKWDIWYKKQGVQQKWPIKNPIIHLIYTSILSFVGDVFVTMAKMQD